MTLRALLAGAVAFQAKHPVLRPVTALLLVAPAFLDHAMRRVLAVQEPLLLPDMPLWEQPLMVATGLVLLFTTIVELWGVSCVLAIARRLLGHPAGRNRRVLLALMREGAHAVPALFFTNVLRICTILLLLLPSLLAVFLLLWQQAPARWLVAAGALTALPAVFYALKTSLYAVVVVGEGLRFRAALRRSADALRGRLLRLSARLLALFAVTLGPAMLLDELLVLRIPSEELSARALVADGAISVVEGVGVLLCTVALAQLYAGIRTATVQSGRLATRAPRKAAARKTPRGRAKR